MGLWACGPSSSEVSGAKTAHYKGDKAAMFEAAKAAVADKYKIDKSDVNELGIQTTARWYTPEGLAAAGDGQDMRQVPNRSLSIAFVVTLRADGDAFIAVVKPLMIRYVAGSPQPQPISEDDPSVPGWATGKVDALALAVHDALKQWEVQTLPGTAGAPAAPAPAPASDGTAPAAPAPAPAPAPAQ